MKYSLLGQTGVRVSRIALAYQQMGFARPGVPDQT